jgi:putative tricarboxylic transport membrane protein
MSDAFLTALENTFSLKVLLVILVSASYGLFVGAIPGLTATMAVALMVPFTFFLDPVSGLAAIVTMEACCIFAGDIPTTLMRIPGTPSSAAYVDDAYALTLQNRHQQALGVSLVFSVIGGLVGALVLIFLAPQLARVAIEFSSYERFWLFVLGLGCAAVVSRGSLAKGLLALSIGLLLSCVGLGSTHSVPRLTFGSDHLITGINFIPAMIGLFGLAEVLRNFSKLMPNATSAADATTSSGNWLRRGIDEVFGGLWKRLSKSGSRILTSSVIGSSIGMLPGAGADIAAWVSYAVSKRRATPEQKDEYGKGSLDGIADATTANNSSLAGAWIPALVLGIPGDSVTAIVIGVLLMKNIQPGPEIFQDPVQLPLVYGIYITFILANLLLIPLGFLAIRAGSMIVRIPRQIILPLILMFCIVGAFAINGSYFDIGVMLVMGLLGVVLERFEVPAGPVVLGIILGSRLEEALVQCLTKSDSLSAFFGRPIAAGLGVLCIVLWLTPFIAWLKRRRNRD